MLRRPSNFISVLELLSSSESRSRSKGRLFDLFLRLYDRFFNLSFFSFLMSPFLLGFFSIITLVIKVYNSLILFTANRALPLTSDSSKSPLPFTVAIDSQNAYESDNCNFSDSV